MNYLHVGMNQGAVMPKTCIGYLGISTHGIDSCTGLALISVGSIFLTHMPPPPSSEHWDEMLSWRARYKGMIEAALSYLVGDVTRAVFISPNTERELPNGGPTLIRNTLDILYGIKSDREVGTKVRLKKDGEVEWASGGQYDQRHEFTGGTDTHWCVKIIN
jgi:hypothetical protein